MQDLPSLDDLKEKLGSIRKVAAAYYKMKEEDVLSDEISKIHDILKKCNLLINGGFMKVR